MLIIEPSVFTVIVQLLLIFKQFYVSIHIVENNFKIHKSELLIQYMFRNQL